LNEMVQYVPFVYSLWVISPYLTAQIYAALDEWKTGSKVTSKFEGNVFATIYKAICRNLEGLRLQNPKAYHVIMADLYNLAV
jgi:hypothetical protein